MAAGYDIVSESGYDETFATFDRLVGLDRISVFHANDSKKPRGSRVDRHEHIGEGCLGLEPFRRLLHAERFSRLAMVIETEKSHRSPKPGGLVPDAYDVKNLATPKALRTQPAA